MSNAGDNHGIQGDELKSYLERIERLIEDKDAIQADLSLLYAAAKKAGYNTTALRKLITLRRQDEGKRKEDQEVLELYDSILGTGIFG